MSTPTNGSVIMYEHSVFTFRGGRDPTLRAADADRDAIGERLRRSHAEGRLDVQEFQERIDRCYEAKTLGELDQLITDLPPDESQRPGAPAARVRWLPVVPILIALLLIAAVTGPHGHLGLWVVLPLFFLARMWRRRRFDRRGWLV